MMNNYPNQMVQPNLMQQYYPTQGRPTFVDIMQQQMQYMAIKGRPVASYDEAKASMIDFDGSIFYFPDAANHKIYTKQINLDGTSSLKTYVLVEPKEPPISPQPLCPDQQATMVSRQEFNLAFQSLLEEIQSLKGAQKVNEQPTTNNVATSKR